MRLAVYTAVFGCVVAVFILVGRGSVTICRASGRAEAEIAFISASLEAYKADYGHYPSNSSTEQLNPDAPYNPGAYAAASEFLYRSLSGLEESGAKDDTALAHKNYIPDFKGRKLRTDKNGVTRIVDPWDNWFGYSTFKATHPENHAGHNPTFDLWSTGGTRGTDQTQWLKNW